MGRWEGRCRRGGDRGAGVGGAIDARSIDLSRDQVPGQVRCVTNTVEVEADGFDPERLHSIRLAQGARADRRADARRARLGSARRLRRAARGGEGGGRARASVPRARRRNGRARADRRRRRRAASGTPRALHRPPRGHAAVGREELLALAARCADVAVPQTGPLPGAYRKTALPALEAALADGRVALSEALAGLDVVHVEIDPQALIDVNTRYDLARL